MKKAKPGPAGSNPTGWINEEVLKIQNKSDKLVSELRIARENLAAACTKISGLIGDAIELDNELSQLMGKLQLPREGK